MNVLMFGWEFPPNISGGLGTACHGLVRGLSTCDDIRVTFVVPHLFGNEAQEYGKIVGLNQFGDSDRRSGVINGRVSLQTELQESVDRPAFCKVVEVDSFLLPYVSEEDFRAMPGPGCEGKARREVDRKAGAGSGSDPAESGLMHEVSKYANQVDLVLQHAGDIDVIHAHDWLTFPAGIKAKERTGKKLVVHVHSTEFDRSGQAINRNIYNVERLGCEAADKVVVVSEFTRNVLINQYGLDPGKIEIVYNAAEPNESSGRGNRADSSVILVTFVGRITYQKGPRYFVEAAYRARQMGANARFVMAGSGDQLASIKSLVGSLGMNDFFQFPGFLDSGGVKKLLADTDIYVMPSISEPFGIAALEAVYAGVPVIISRNSGVSEVVKSMIKVDPKDTEKIAAEILRLSMDPKWAHSVSSNAKNEACELSWYRSAQKLAAIYTHLVS